MCKLFCRASKVEVALTRLEPIEEQERCKSKGDDTGEKRSTIRKGQAGADGDQARSPVTNR